MRVRLLIVSLTLLAGACGAPRPFGEGVELQTLLYGGARALSHDEFDGHGMVALELATNDPENGFGYELGGSYAAEDEESGGVEREGEFNELALGLRRTWRTSSGRRTVLGAGGAFTRVEHTLRSPTREFDEEGGAVYAHVALQWELGPVDIDPGTDFLIGVDLRALAGDDYDYAQLALVLGFGR